MKPVIEEMSMQSVRRQWPALSSSGQLFALVYYLRYQIILKSDKGSYEKNIC